MSRGVDGMEGGKEKRGGGKKGDYNPLHEEEEEEEEGEESESDYIKNFKAKSRKYSKISFCVEFP